MLAEHQIEYELIDAEGLSFTCYKCPAGKLTVGVGHRVDSECSPITLEYAGKLLKDDIKVARDGLIRNVPCFPGLSDARQLVLICMAFQLGIKGLLGFKKMLLALENGAFVTASNEMLDSKWARQCPKRAKRLAGFMKNGVLND